MSVLSGSDRRLLSEVVVRAREVVESACRQRVLSLGVGSERVPEVFPESDRVLRRQLRARAKQLGSVEALVAEAGFEHWHRMLFARCLVDNGLLVDDMAGAPVSAAELVEWAVELGEPDRWEVASRFASAMLPGIFRVDDPVLAMRLPVEARQELEGLLDQLGPDLIRADDALGWVYQYWQSKRKDEVNNAGDKIGGADLPPVTQLFTEDYMVRFLLQNSLGAWWAARHPDSPLVADWEFLRRDDDGAPAAGSFEEWPSLVAEVTVMDPCCGSGHFLVAAFEMLWRMRAEEEGLPPAAAQDAVMRDSMFGLELDARCAQIAIFALALAAWKAGGYRALPLPNVACSGIPAKAQLSDWTVLAGGDARVESALTRLHALFANADTLGSLIDPVRAAEQAGLESVDWHEVAPLVQKALTAEAGKHVEDPTAAVFGEAAAGIARAADYLSRRYTLIATNPPYLTVQRMPEAIAVQLEEEYPDAAGDLATVFLQRSQRLSHLGCCAHVTPMGWLALRTSRPLRRAIFNSSHLHALAVLGASAFGAISGHVVQVALMVLGPATEASDALVLDVRDAASVEDKAAELRERPFSRVSPQEVRASWDSPLAFGQSEAEPLSSYASSWQGLVTTDVAQFIVKHWEVPGRRQKWERYLTAPRATRMFTGRDSYLRWDGGQGTLVRQGHNFSPASVLGRAGVLIGQGSLSATLYLGEMFNDASSPLVPSKSTDVAAVWAFVSSPEYVAAVRRINHKVIVGSGYLIKVPFDVVYWRGVAAERFPEGLPQPRSDDPTQWLFRGVVAGSSEPLQVAVARLLGFRWPDQEPDSLDRFADDDGVVCLPAVGGEIEAADRLRELLEFAFRDEWSPTLLDDMLAGVGAKAGIDGLRRWLRDGCFKDHCRVFANRPFVWQIWDGNPAGFSALVDYHRLDRRLLARLTHDYLGSWWLTKVRDEVKSGVAGAEGRVKAAEDLKARLEAILEGEPPYDIYVRWKPLSEQPIGWQPDLDDGVRLNIRPFMTAGVLRHQPKIKWDKDRGKNPNGTERHNDLHHTNDQKRRARQGDSR